MIRSVILIALALIFSLDLKAQSTAMDFTATDCYGTPHQLYSELDSGNVVVLDFIMLSCSSCIVATNALSSIVNQYETSHPGRVRLYSFGFLDVYTCPQLQSWMSSNNYKHTIFNNGNTQVNYYGGMGMPTIVVASGNGYNIEYKKLGYSSSDDNAIIAAINKGLLFTPVFLDEEQDDDGFLVYPTFFSNNITVESYVNEVVSFELLDVRGCTVFKSVNDGNQVWSQSMPKLNSGFFYAKISMSDGSLRTVKLFSIGQ